MTAMAPELAAAALEAAGDGIIVIDTAGVIRGWNAHAARLFGFTPEQAIGQPVSIIIPERLREAHDRGFSAAMQAGRLASDGAARRTKGVTADGDTVYVTMTFAVISGPDGTAEGSVAVARRWDGDQ